MNTRSVQRSVQSKHKFALAATRSLCPCCSCNVPAAACELRCRVCQDRTMLCSFAARSVYPVVGFICRFCSCSSCLSWCLPGSCALDVHTCSLVPVPPHWHSWLCFRLWRSLLSSHPILALATAELSTCTRSVHSMACPIFAAQYRAVLGVRRVWHQMSFGKLCVTSHRAKRTVKWRYWRLNAGLWSAWESTGLLPCEGRMREGDEQPKAVIIYWFLFPEEYLNTQQAFADTAWLRQTPKSWGFRLERRELFWTAPARYLYMSTCCSVLSSAYHRIIESYP